MQPSLEEIKQLQSQGNVIPVYKSVIADFLTPVSAFLKLEKDHYLGRDICVHEFSHSIRNHGIPRDVRAR